MHACGDLTRENVRDRMSAVDGRAIPDEHDRAGYRAEEDAQEAHHRFCV